MSTSPFFSQGSHPRSQGDRHSPTPPREALLTGTSALTIRVEQQTRERSDSSDDTPPNTDNRKRAHIDVSIATPGDKSQLSPLKAAENFIVSHTASLRNEIATLLLDRGREHINLAHKAFSKHRNQSRMEGDDDYIPVSARVEFRLQAVKEAEELPEFQQLQDQAAEVIKGKQVALKRLIIDTLKLERKVLQEKVNKHFCESIFMATKLFLTAQGVDTAQSHNTVAQMLAQHWETLLKHTGLTVEEFVALYKATLHIGAQPPATIDSHNSIQIGSIKRAIESVFVFSWDRYLGQIQENELSISLKKEVKEQLLWRKTEDATMEVDSELPLDRDQLRDLIRREAEAMTKKMVRKEVDAKLDSAKNTMRGQTAKGASDKKKKESNRKQKEKDKKNEKEEKEKKENRGREEKRKRTSGKRQTNNQSRNHSHARSHTQRNDQKAGGADNDSKHTSLQQRRSKSMQRKRNRASNNKRQQS